MSARFYQTRWFKLTKPEIAQQFYKRGVHRTARAKGRLCCFFCEKSIVGGARYFAVNSDKYAHESCVVSNSDGLVKEKMVITKSASNIRKSGNRNARSQFRSPAEMQKEFKRRLNAQSKKIPTSATNHNKKPPVSVLKQRERKVAPTSRKSAVSKIMRWSDLSKLELSNQFYSRGVEGTSGIKLRRTCLLCDKPISAGVNYYNVYGAKFAHKSCVISNSNGLVPEEASRKKKADLRAAKISKREPKRKVVRAIKADRDMKLGTAKKTNGNK